MSALVLSGGTRPVEPQRSADDPTVSIPESHRGLSGRLQARIVRSPSDSAVVLHPVASVVGDSVGAPAAVWVVRDSATDQPFHFITLVPFAAKREERVGQYRVGRWPSEGGDGAAAARVPVGFVVVTEENRQLPVSAHFRLEQFLDRSQRDVWPKVLVLDERLVDKLELLVEALRAEGHAIDGLTVLSGFRTPQANARGTRSQQTPDSRHQYGEAADIIVDADGDGRMDDLNRDGVVDDRDAVELARLIDAVERRHPALVGGVGIYRAAGASGPFVHVDVRGRRVRWTIER